MNPHKTLHPMAGLPMPTCEKSCHTDAKVSWVVASRGVKSRGQKVKVLHMFIPPINWQLISLISSISWLKTVLISKSR